MHTPHRTLKRREFTATVAAGLSLWAAPFAYAQDAAGRDGRLIVVFLRGAYDGLSALVPYADQQYYALRPTIAIAAPDGTAQTAIALDDSFALHPALAPLLPLWKQGILAALPCAGSPDATRSHFDAQHHWEIGVPGMSGNAAGWMNTLAGAANTSGSGVQLVGVGEANPQILAGSAPVQLVPRGQAATRQGALGDERTRDAIMKLYAGQDTLSQAFRAGAQSRQQTAQMLSGEMIAADNGANSVQGLQLDAQHLGTLMRQDRKLRLGFLSAGGWDTHFNQGAATGTLATNLGSLAQTLVQLRKDFNRPDDVVVVCSEFGRTSAENGTRGTDHGHGNAMWLMGNRVNGGHWHGNWSGLSAANLHEGRDLPVHHDFRAVLAQVVRHTQGIKANALDRIFPGFAWDAALDNVMRS